jgi:2-hydroxychromene-2-carboxylate isomerase
MEVELVYDVVCPYAYLASTRIEAIAAEAGATVRWSPILLGGVFQAIGAPPRSATPAPKTAAIRRDLINQARRFGVPLVEPAAHPRRTVEAMRLLVAAPDAARPALTHALYRAYWVEGRDVADRAVLSAIGSAHGVDVDAALADRDTLRARTDAAVARGVFGVPTVFVGGRLHWGSDRLHLVRKDLGLPRVAVRPAAPRAGRRLVVWHDVASPFSYLASTQLPMIAARHGATLEWRPILLGALFRQVGTPDVPMLAMPAAKQRWVARDLEDAAAWFGVPFAFRTRFPLRSVLAQRVLVQAPEATAAVYRATWVEDRDVGDPATLTAVLVDAGFDGPGLVAGADDPAVKARLRTNTEEAEARGVFGVPTVEVHDADGVLTVWGQDRLDAVDERLAAG